MTESQPLRTHPPAPDESGSSSERLAASVKAAIARSLADDWADGVHRLLQEGTHEQMRSEYLDHRRTLILEKKRKRFSEKTFAQAEHFLSLFETLIERRKSVSRLQAHLELYQNPRQRQQLSPQEQTQLRSLVQRLREELQSFQQQRTQTQYAFDRYAKQRLQERTEEASLRASLEEYLQWVEPRVRGRLETQVRNKLDEQDFEQRLALLQTVIGHLLSTSPAIAQAEIKRLILLAQAMLGQNQPDEALLKLQQALSFDSRHSRLHALLAEVWKQKQNPLRAIQSLRQAVECEPDKPLYLLSLARLYEQQEQLQEAIFYYRKASALRPQDSILHHRLAKLAYENGQWELAADALAQALAEKPESYALRHRLGIAQVQCGRWEAGIHTIKQALRQQDKDARLHYYLGCALQNLDDHAEAHQEFRQAFHLAPQDPLILPALAQSHLNRGEAEICLELCRQALSLNPHTPAGRLLLAKALRQQHRTAEAIDLLQSLIEQGNPSVELLSEYASACLQGNESERAYPVLKAALEPPRSDAAPDRDLRRLLGQLCLSTGRFQEALDYLG